MQIFTWRRYTKGEATLPLLTVLPFLCESLTKCTPDEYKTLSFTPLEQTPFENYTPTSPLREHRLYQASFLLRDYGWKVEDLAFADNGNLRTDIDPKQAWAEAHLRQNPIDIMRASREQLLRVPGIGPRGARAIMEARSLGHLTELAHLRKLGIRNPEQMTPYILLNGRRVDLQMSLF